MTQIPFRPARPRLPIDTRGRVTNQGWILFGPYAKRMTLPAERGRSPPAACLSVEGGLQNSRVSTPVIPLRTGTVRGPAVGVLLQILRIQRLQILRQELPVLANQFAVEPHFAAAPFLALNQHHVPVDGRAIAVVAHFIRLAGCEVERA